MLYGCVCATVAAEKSLLYLQPLSALLSPSHLEGSSYFECRQAGRQGRHRIGLDWIEDSGAKVSTVLAPVWKHLKLQIQKREIKLALSLFLYLVLLFFIEVEKEEKEEEEEEEEEEEREEAHVCIHKIAKREREATNGFFSPSPSPSSPSSVGIASLLSWSAWRTHHYRLLLAVQWSLPYIPHFFLFFPPITHCRLLL